MVDSAGQYFYTNRFGRNWLLTLENLLGTNGVNAFLDLAGLKHYIRNYPPDDLTREFDITAFAALHHALDDMHHGEKDNRQKMSYRSGQMLGKHGLLWYSGMAGLKNESFKTLPLADKLKLAVPAIAVFLSDFQLDAAANFIHDHDDRYVYAPDICPNCYGLGHLQPTYPGQNGVCFAICGVFEGGLSLLTGETFKVTETACAVYGAEKCVFEIPKVPIAKG